MRSFHLYAALLVLPILVEAQSVPVTARETRAGITITLSRSIRKAIHAFDSSFIPLTKNDYIKALREKARPSADGYLSFCTGDFDGNGLTDAALLGKSGGGMRLIAAFQQKKNVYRIVRVKEFPFFEPGEEDAYLTKNPAHTLNVTADKRTISFSTDAFLLTYYRRGSLLYHWNGREFDLHQLGE